MRQATKQNSHIGTIRRIHTHDMARVMHCLKWTQQEYCDFQFFQYCAFVDTLTEGWAKVREEILYSPVFRGFWNSEWAKRDAEEFLEFAMDIQDRDYVTSEYLFIHDHKRLLDEDEFMNRYSHLLKLI
ncbi:hypothetical protein [Rhodonellum sp.]|uniref:hypothetical protein n=1 Tax=Rhodonellum sp. TaxID=2231180 RepID=UPI00271B8BB6|nr:hypothetical protein [Rhodonellum sp.]MDO9554561.1 hypothetical protein [Rhodonellum sp.]